MQVKKVIFVCVFLVFSINSFGNGCKQAKIEVCLGGDINGESVERKSKMLFKNFFYLMEMCDKYRESWSFRKKNIKLYLLSKAEVVKFVKLQPDVIKEIEEKIEFYENKKILYAQILGKLYFALEPFIDGFSQKVDAILPEEYSDNYFNEELKEIEKFSPAIFPKSRFGRYTVGAVGAIVAVSILYYYKKTIYNFYRNFVVNQVFNPLINLKNCLFGSNDNKEFLAMSLEEMLKDMEGQKKVLRKKVKDLVVAIDPKVERKYIDGLIDQAKTEGVESFVGRCIRKAKKSSEYENLSQNKPGWIEWFLVGNKVKDTLGLGPKDKLLELEIKVLLSRLAATKFLIEAKDGIDSNKLTMILGSLLPVILASVGSYKLLNKIHEWYKNIPKKKKDINDIMFSMTDIIKRNIDKEQMSCQDQGLICYLAYRFKECLSVVPENCRESFEQDLSYISSSVNLGR